MSEMQSMLLKVEDILNWKYAWLIYEYLEIYRKSWMSSLAYIFL